MKILKKKIQGEWAFGAVAKKLLGKPTPHMTVPGFESQSAPDSSFPLMHTLGAPDSDSVM